jgi:tRNA A22 N-methylase
VVRDSGSLFLVVTVDPALRERYRLTAAERELGPCLLRHLDQSLVKEYVQQWRKKVRRVLGELARSERSESRARIEYLTSALREVEEVL